MSDAKSIVELIPRLRRYARALVGDRVAADDLVQDTLERAWAKLHLYRRGTDLRAWLFTVMHNVFVNQRRAARPTAPIDEAMPELAQAPRETDGLVLRDLELAIRRLPVEQREVLLLVALEDMSYEEAAGVDRHACSCHPAIAPTASPMAIQPAAMAAGRQPPPRGARSCGGTGSSSTGS